MTETRGLTFDTLKKFKVGVGPEKYYDQEDQQWITENSIYFPMYSPLSSKARDKKAEKLNKKLNSLNSKDK